MRPLRQLCAAIVLTLALALSSFAGDMSTGITAPPPPPTEQATTQGDMSTTVAADITPAVPTINPATDIVLNLLQSLLLLF